MNTFICFFVLALISSGTINAETTMTVNSSSNNKMKQSRLDIILHQKHVQRNISEILATIPIKVGRLIYLKIPVHLVTSHRVFHTNELSFSLRTQDNLPLYKTSWIGCCSESKEIVTFPMKGNEGKFRFLLVPLISNQPLSERYYLDVIVEGSKNVYMHRIIFTLGINTIKILRERNIRIQFVKLLVSYLRSMGLFVKFNDIWIMETNPSTGNIVWTLTRIEPSTCDKIITDLLPKYFLKNGKPNKNLLAVFDGYFHITNVKIELKSPCVLTSTKNSGGDKKTYLAPTVISIIVVVLITPIVIAFIIRWHSRNQQNRYPSALVGELKVCNTTQTNKTSKNYSNTSQDDISNTKRKTSWVPFRNVFEEKSRLQLIKNELRRKTEYVSSDKSPNILNTTYTGNDTVDTNVQQQHTVTFSDNLKSKTFATPYKIDNHQRDTSRTRSVRLSTTPQKEHRFINKSNLTSAKSMDMESFSSKDNQSNCTIDARSGGIIARNDRAYSEMNLANCDQYLLDRSKQFIPSGKKQQYADNYKNVKKGNQKKGCRYNEESRHKIIRSNLNQSMETISGIIQSAVSKVSLLVGNNPDSTKSTNLKINNQMYQNHDDIEDTRGPTIRKEVNTTSKVNVDINRMLLDCYHNNWYSSNNISREHWQTDLNEESNYTTVPYIQSPQDYNCEPYQQQLQRVPAHYRYIDEQCFDNTIYGNTSNHNREVYNHAKSNELLNNNEWVRTCQSDIAQNNVCLQDDSFSDQDVIQDASKSIILRHESSNYSSFDQIEINEISNSFRNQTEITTNDDSSSLNQLGINRNDNDDSAFEGARISSDSCNYQERINDNHSSSIERTGMDNDHGNDRNNQIKINRYNNNAFLEQVNKSASFDEAIRHNIPKTYSSVDKLSLTKENVSSHTGQERFADVYRTISDPNQHSQRYLQQEQNIDDKNSYENVNNKRGRNINMDTNNYFMAGKENSLNISGERIQQRRGFYGSLNSINQRNSQSQLLIQKNKLCNEKSNSEENRSSFNQQKEYYIEFKDNKKRKSSWVRRQEFLASRRNTIDIFSSEEGSYNYEDKKAINSEIDFDDAV